MTPGFHERQAPSAGPSPRRLVGTAVATISVRYFGVVAGTVAAIFVARAIGANGRGSIAWVIAISGVALSFAHLSLEQVMLRAWSGREHRAGLLGTTAVVSLVGGSAVALVGSVLIVAGVVDPPAGVDMWMVLVALWILPARLVSLYATAALTNDGRFRPINAASLAGSVVQLALVLLLWATSWLTVTTALMLWVAAALAPLAIHLPAVRRSPGFVRPDLAGLRRAVAQGLKFHIGTLALSLILRVDVLLLAREVTIAQVGIYSLAVTIIELSWTVTNSVAQLAVQFQLKKSHQDVVAVTAAVFRLNVVLAGALAFVAVTAGPFVIPAVFGNSFEGTTAAIGALAPGIVALAVQRPLGIHMTRSQKPLAVAAAMVAALVVNVGLNLALIPTMGIIGAGIASSVAYSLLAGWFIVWFVRSTELPPRHLLPRVDDVRRIAQSTSRRS